MKKKSLIWGVYFKMKIFETLLILLMFAFLIGIIFVIIDTPSLKQIGKEEVNCYDKYGSEINGTICYKDVTCSKRGFVGDYKCKEINETKW